MRHSTKKTPDTQLSQFRVKGEIPVPVLINWLTTFAILLLVFFAWRSDTRSHDLSTPAFLLAFAILLGANALLYRIGGSKTLQRRGFIAAITLLFTYLATHAVEDGSAILWLFAYPPIVFYISESRVGVTACAGGLAGVIVLFSPLGDLIFDTPYTTSFRLSLIIALAFEMTTCYILDQSRRRSKLGLLKLAADFEHAAKHDALTGLANRREGLEQLEGEHDRYRRNSRPFSVLLMDIDLFKQVNDTHGHHVGDELIILVARILREQCRKVDTIARWGGEEYLALLPETSEQEATQIANRVRLAIAGSAITREGATREGATIQATISAGVAAIEGGESIDRLLQRADEALYVAKKQGRNRVCSYNKTECVA